MSVFTDKEWQRYQRHVQLGGFGAAGQTKLKHAKVLIVGVGGLGCPVAQYLASAGVGTVTLVDGDVVARSNLQRQILFAEADVGAFKVDVAKRRLLEANPHINLTAVAQHLNDDNVSALIAAADLVLDCTDNFSVRYLINDTCRRLNKAWVYGSVTAYSGQVALFGGDACYRCLVPVAPENIDDCNSAGVLGSLPGVIGTLQATEALKLIANVGETLKNQLLVVEGKTTEFTKLAITRNPDCWCSAATDDASDMPTIASCAAPNTDYELSAAEFKQVITQANGNVIDVRSVEEHAAFNIGGKNIPLSDNFSVQLKSQSAPAYLYCQTGARSARARELLLDAGVTEVYCLRGGIAAWLEHYLK